MQVLLSTICSPISELCGLFITNCHKIKGYYTADPAEEMADKKALAPVKPYEIRELYEDLVKEHNVIFEYWLKPDYSAKALEDSGYKFFQLQRALDNGTINCWIQRSISI
jgi:hypothetical protein